MIQLPEMEKKLPLEERKQIIKELARGKGGQALREELVDIINDVVNVSKIPAYAFESNEILASETRAMNKAKAYIQAIYTKLIPEEETKPSNKIHK